MASNKKDIWSIIATEVKAPEASTFRKLGYGFEKATWLGSDLANILNYDEEERKRLEAERLKKIEEEYSDLTKEEKESGWATVGEVGSLILDPTAIPLYALGGVGAATKAASLASRLGATSKVAMRASRAAPVGAVSGLDYIVREKGRGEEIDPATLSFSVGAGAVLGSLFPVKTPKSLEEGAEKAKETLNAVFNPKTKKLKPSKVSDTLSSPLENVEEQNLVNKLTAEFNEEAPDSYSNAIDVFSNGWTITKANNIKKAYDEQKKLRKSRKDNKNRISDSEFKRLKALKEESDTYRKDGLYKNLSSQVETTSDDAIKLAEKYERGGILNKNTIAQAVYRPIMGAAGGFGLGATLNIFSDGEDEFDPLTWALMGLTAGAISKKIVNSKFSQEIKDAGVEAAESIPRKSMWASANVFFSGSSSAKGSAFGGDVQTFTNTVLSNVGTDLKGALGSSIEEASDLVQTDITKSWLTNLSDLGVLNTKRAAELRSASYMKAEGFWDEAALQAKGFSNEEISNISKLSDIALDNTRRISDEVDNVGIQYTKLKDYKLPQMQNIPQIVKEQDKAREFYERVWLTEKEIKKGKPLTQKEIERSTDHIHGWFDDLVAFGGGRNKMQSAFAVPPKGGAKYLKSPMRPLADHFEKERKFVTFEAREMLANEGYLITDVDRLMKGYINQSVPIIEFARRLGAKGEGVDTMKRSINLKFNKAKQQAKTGRERNKLAELQSKHIKTVNEVVDNFFGFTHASSYFANNKFANSVMSVLVTGANISFLPKVTITSLGELAQPFINSNSFSALKGLGRTLNKSKDFSQESGFANKDVMEHELRQYVLDSVNPDSTIQRSTRKLNEFFFRRITFLSPYTAWSRKLGYNTGVEDTFDIAKKMAKKKTTALQARANYYGLKSDDIDYLNKFNKIEDAFDDNRGRRLLNIGGNRVTNRDIIIPGHGNRRAISQSRDPIVKSFSQFLSWAQAKTTQTNSLISRMEDGDHALFAKMVGSLVLYDGVVTFRDYLNDPTGEWLDERDEDSYKEAYGTLENVGRSVNHSGNFSHYLIDKFARLMSSHGGKHPLEELWPVLGWATEMFDGISPIPGDHQGSIWRNLYDDDTEGALKQSVKRMPLGDEILDFLKVMDMPLEDRGKLKSKSFISPITYSKGGVVENVPQVPKEPDERIDKLTGRPYNEQAGTAFIDEGDPVRRLGFLGGGLAENPIRRLGFGKGSLAKKKRKKYVMGRLVSAYTRLKRAIDPDDLMTENPTALPIARLDPETTATMTTDEVMELQKKMWDDVPDEVIEEAPVEKVEAEPVTMLTPAKPLDIGIDESLADGSKLKNYSVVEAEELDSLIPKATAGTKAADKLILAPVAEGTKAGVRLNLNSKIEGASNPALSKLQTVHENNYNGKALSYAPYVTLKNVKFTVNQKGRVGIASKIKGLDVPESRNKFPAMSVDGTYTAQRNVLKEMDNDVVEIGINPAGQHLFIDLRTGQAVESADIATVIGDRVYAKGVKYFKKSEAPKPLTASDGTDIGSTVRYRRNKGGKVYKALRKRKAEGGYTTESGTLEPEEAIKFTMETYFPEDKPHVVDYLINQAQVESRLGKDKNTYNIRTSSYVDGSTMRGGFGIHQIDEIAFEDVKNRLIGGGGVPSGIKKYGKMVTEAFGKENLKDIEYEDLRDPVNNTIFSRLIHKTKSDPIPEDIEGQAKYWTDNYNKSAIPKIAERRGISVQKVMESMGSNTEIQKAVDDFRKELNEKFIERLNKNSGGKVLYSLKRFNKGGENTIPDDMKRPDGTVKSKHGFVGPIKSNVTDKIHTELATNFDEVLGGRQIPLIVSTLTEEEIDWFRNNNAEGNMKIVPKSIKDKAIEHAIMRDRDGLDPFYQDGEEAWSY